MTDHGELVFFQIAPINISVLSCDNIQRKISHLQGLISMHPDLEIVCTDSCECFDGNREYLRRRAIKESNPQVRAILEQPKSAEPKTFFDCIAPGQNPDRAITFFALFPA